jgi:hypothetical protein
MQIGEILVCQAFEGHTHIENKKTTAAQNCLDISTFAIDMVNRRILWHEKKYKYNMPAKPKLFEELGDELCEHCPKKSDVNTNQYNLCEGRWCGDAYQNYLDNFEGGE